MLTKEFQRNVIVSIRFCLQTHAKLTFRRNINNSRTKVWTERSYSYLFAAVEYYSHCFPCLLSDVRNDPRSNNCSFQNCDLFAPVAQIFFVLPDEWRDSNY